MSDLVTHAGGDGCSIESRMNGGCGLLDWPTESGRDEGWNLIRGLGEMPLVACRSGGAGEKFDSNEFQKCASDAVTRSKIEDRLRRIGVQEVSHFSTL